MNEKNVYCLNCEKLIDETTAEHERLTGHTLFEVREPVERSEVDSLKAENESLSEANKILTDAENVEIAKLKADNENLVSERDKLKADFEGVNKSNETLAQANENLQTANDALTQANADLTTANDLLTETNKSLEAELEAAKKPKRHN